MTTKVSRNELGSDRPIRQRPAFRKTANVLTDIRSHGGVLLAGRIVTRGESFRSWGLAAGAVGLMVTDSLDGIFGRRSNIPSPEYTRRDEQNDKVLYLLAMAAMARASGDRRYGAYIGLTEARNTVVEDMREKLREHGLPSGARKWGKSKTLVQNIGIVLDLSPMGTRYPKAVHAVHGSAVAMAALSAADIVYMGQRQLAAVTEEAVIIDFPIPNHSLSETDANHGKILDQ